MERNELRGIKHNRQLKPANHYARSAEEKIVKTIDDWDT
jgi:hypothetical protein